MMLDLVVKLVLEVYLMTEVGDDGMQTVLCG